MSVSPVAIATLLCAIIASVQGNGGDNVGDGTVLGNMKLPEARVSLNSQMDQIFAKVRTNLSAEGFNSISLPHAEDTFSVTLFSKTLDGSVWLGDDSSSLAGIATIHRHGDISLTAGRTQVVEGAVALTGIKAKYSGGSEVGLFKTNFGVTFDIPSFILEFKANVTLTQGIYLEYCDAQDFRYTHVELDGLGPLDTRLFETLINTLLQVLKAPIADVVGNVVCEVIRDILNGSQGHIITM